MVSWLRPQRSLITFDLGAAGIRACQVQRSRRAGNRGRAGGLTLRDSLHVERRSATENDKATPPIVDAAQLDRLIGQGAFCGRDVALILSPPEVQFLPLHLPPQALAQPRQRIEQALCWEVAQASRKSGDELEVRFWHLPAGRGQQANVMAVAMAADAAARWGEEFARCRLALRRIDVSPCALVHLACRAWTPTEQDLWGVLDLGRRHSILTVVVGAVPTYVRELSISPHDWTQRLSEAFEVSHAVAEELKRQHGVRPTERGLGQSSRARNPLAAGDIQDAVSSVLRESLETLAHETTRCFSYVFQSYPDVNLRRLFLAGGGASIPGLADGLGANLGIDVTVLATAGQPDDDTWERPLPDVPFEPQVAASLGGAMLGLEVP